MLVVGMLACPAHGQPDYLVRTIAGEEIAASSWRVDRAGVVHYRVGEGEPGAIGIDLLSSIVRVDAQQRPIDPPASTLWLRSGAAFPATWVGAEEAGGRFALPWTRDPLKVSWRHVQAVLLDTVGPVDDGFVASLREPPDRNDLLFAKREGEIVRVSVEILSVADDAVTVRVGGAERSMPLSRVHGLVWGEFSGAAPDRQPNPRVVLVADDGSRIGGVATEVDEAAWLLRLDEGSVLRIPRDRVARARVLSDRLVYLTDLQPAVEQVAALDRTWPPLLDSGPGGGPIMVGGRPYGRGLVLFPRTTMTYDIEGRFDVLEAMIGFEDRAGPAANAVFRVLADDRLLFDSGPMTPRDGARPLQVPITDAKRLTVEVDFGEGLDLGDVCVLAGARLVKW